EVHQAVPNQRTQCVVVDVIAVGTAERRVQRTAVAPQMLRGPVLGFFTCDGRGHESRSFPAGRRHEVSGKVDDYYVRAMVERHVRFTQRSMHLNGSPDFHWAL